VGVGGNRGGGGGGGGVGGRNLKTREGEKAKEEDREARFRLYKQLISKKGR